MVDEEGDMVRISSQDEVQEAIKSAKDGVLSIHVVNKGGWGIRQVI